MARFVNVDLLAEPGDRFEPGTYQPDSDRQTVGLVNGGNLLDGRPLAILGDIPTLMAMADSFVASAWALKTAADAAAASSAETVTALSDDGWRFRCNLHGVNLRGGEYQAHCDEAHGGLQIAVTMIPPSDDAATEAQS